MTKTNKENTEEQILTCGVCGRDIKASEIVWDDVSGEPLCPACFAEQESCGCSD